MCERERERELAVTLIWTSPQGTLPTLQTAPPDNARGACEGPPYKEGLSTNDRDQAGTSSCELIMFAEEG